MYNPISELLFRWKKLKMLSDINHSIYYSRQMVKSTKSGLYVAGTTHGIESA